MKPKSIILLVLALGCGLVASIGINRVMANRPAAEVVEGDMVTIYVAALDVNQNNLVPKDAIKEEEWPAAKIPQGAIMTLEDIEGRRTKQKLYAGEPFLDNKLLTKGNNGQSVDDNIPAGFRVVATRVDDVTTLGSLILPGDRVDILVHLPPIPRLGFQEAITKTFLQDIRVFAVNDITERAPDGGEAKITARTISFLVEPKQAELITQAAELGRIRLVLRNSKDQDVAETPGADANGLFGASGAGDRAAEAEASQTNKSGDKNPFLQQILQPTPTPVVVAAAEPERHEFKMTIMRGPDIQEYVLEDGSSVARPVGTGEPADDVESSEPLDSMDEDEAEDLEEAEPV